MENNENKDIKENAENKAEIAVENTETGTEKETLGFAKIVKNVFWPRKEESKLRKTFRIAGFAIAAILFVITVVFMRFLHIVDILPKDYKMLIDILLVLICIVALLSQRWFIPGIITKILSIALGVILIIGCIYINTTYRTIKKITGETTKRTGICVYVKSDSALTDVAQIGGKTVGIVGDIDREKTDLAVSHIKTEKKVDFSTQEYEDAIALAEALLSGEVEVIILNSSFVAIAQLANEDFETLTKVLYEYEIIEKIKEPNKPKPDDNGNNSPEPETDAEGNSLVSSSDCITMYISGIDIEGSPASNRNSDVNIIAIFNLKTYQIFLLNTPRDYYVPLSISNGVRDKLTHAGCFGIDCSVATLELLYGIKIDYYLKLNFTGFKRIIDALGGVNVYSAYDFVSRHGKFHFTKGYNQMNGEMALGFVRERSSFGSGDRQRGKNQMALIEALLKKLMSSDMIKNYNSVLNALGDCMITSMPYEQIGDLCKLQLDKNPSWDIQNYAVSGNGDTLPGFSFKAPNYVMVPDENFINTAKILLKQILSNIVIDTSPLVY